MSRFDGTGPKAKQELYHQHRTIFARMQSNRDAWNGTSSDNRTGHSELSGAFFFIRGTHAVFKDTNKLVRTVVDYKATIFELVLLLHHHPAPMSGR